jgi:hypothetical protein
MTAAHIHPMSFPSESSSATHKDYFLQYIAISFILIIHHVNTHVWTFISSDLHGRLAALGFLCPIQDLLKELEDGRLLRDLED